MKKILLLLFAISITTSPVSAWGDGGCSFSNKNNESQEATLEKVENSDSSNQ